MRFTYQSSLTRYQRISKRLKGAPGEDDAIRRALSKQLLYERTRISIRTKKGKDVNEQAFSPGYHPSYARAKEKGKVYQNGRPVKAASRQVKHVNLTLSGAMLKSMQISTKKPQKGLFTGYVSIAPAHAYKAKYALDYGRHFFGFSKKAKRRILKALRGAVLDYKISSVLRK